MAPLSLKIILDEGAVTRTVKFDSGTKVADAYAVIREKILTADDGKEYALFLTSADNDQSGIWLEPHRPLDYYMLRNGDSLLYLRRQRNLRVKMLDGAVKTLQVDESKTIGELMTHICLKIGITNYDEYGLCPEEPTDQEEAKEKPATGTLTLKRKIQREKDSKMDELSKKLKSDDNVEWLDQHKTLRELGVELHETLLLKRRLFYSDRNVDSRDPVQLNLLYLQTRDDILTGRHPVTENQAADCKLRWVHIRDVHRRILRKRIREPSNKPKLYKYDKELAFMRPLYKELDVQHAIELEENDDEEASIAMPSFQCSYDDADNQQLDNDPMMEDAAAESDESYKPVKSVKRGAKRRRRLITKNKLKSEDEPEELDKTVNSDEVPTHLDPRDPVDAFLLSIGATLKTFSAYHLNLAKSKIFAVVQEHEMEQIVERPQEAIESKVSTSHNDHLYTN